MHCWPPSDVESFRLFATKSVAFHAERSNCSGARFPIGSLMWFRESMLRRVPVFLRRRRFCAMKMGTSLWRTRRSGRLLAIFKTFFIAFSCNKCRHFIFCLFKFRQDSRFSVSDERHGPEASFSVCSGRLENHSKYSEKILSGFFVDVTVCRYSEHYFRICLQVTGRISSF